MRWPLALLLLAPLPASANVRGRAPVRANGLGGNSVVTPVTLQVTPLTLLPAASLGAAPQLGASQLSAPAAALVPAGALVSQPAAPVAPIAAGGGIVPLAAPAAAQEGPQRLIDTLSVPLAMPESSAGSAESATASEADFMARAQLGGSIKGSPAAALGALSARPAPSGLLKAGPGGASSKLSPAAQVLPFAGVDHSGDVMAAALARLDAAAPGTALTLNFTPSPKSLALLAARAEPLVLSGTGEAWTLRKGGLDSAPAAERTIVNRAKLETADIAASAGRSGRFFAATPKGLHEWNPDLPADLASRLSGRLNSFLLGSALLRGAALSRASVAHALTPWSKLGGLDGGPQPLNERILIDTLIPRWIAAELPIVAQRIGRPLDDAHKADVLRRSVGYRMYWHSSMTYKDHPDNAGIPDGHFSPKFGIRLMVKPDWRKLQDLETHFRVLFAHEYTHWLQEEGVVSGRGDHEAEAVAVEMLRAIELVGLADVEAGRTGTIHANNLGHFATGREMVMKDWYEAGLFVRGSLGGAAYEVGLRAGRPEAAWEFFRIVTKPANQKAASMTLVPRARDAVLSRP